MKSALYFTTNVSERENFVRCVLEYGAMVERGATHLVRPLPLARSACVQAHASSACIARTHPFHALCSRVVTCSLIDSLSCSFPAAHSTTTALEVGDRSRQAGAQWATRGTAAAGGSAAQQGRAARKATKASSRDERGACREARNLALDAATCTSLTAFPRTHTARAPL